MKGNVVFLMTLFCACLSSSLPAAPSISSPGAMVLTDEELDAVTAGAVSSVTNVRAFAGGPTFAETMTYAKTHAFSRQGSRRTGGEGSAAARGDGFAFSDGSSTSVADSTSVIVRGGATAMGEDANAVTRVSTHAVDAGRVQVAVGHVHSVACCGTGTDTGAQTAISTTADFSVGHVTSTKINAGPMSLSFGHAVVVSFSPF